MTGIVFVPAMLTLATGNEGSKTGGLVGRERDSSDFFELSEVPASGDGKGDRRRTTATNG